MYPHDTLNPLALTGNTDDTIGGRISLARDALGLSVEEISSVVGVTDDTWSNWENDRSEPRANRLDMLARVLQVNITWLLSGQTQGLEGDARTPFQT
ncbi:helix-turn-helix transcriptional regulator [Rhizobium sp. PL01]|uniref:helix-turn-helix domain-containing protein n=1 Tax=Rhizobium sp. PL01 TaxID=3085631 RepID=UPI00298166C5|nr:helix-turn-helix transcriptional regulator [Rhizobium sp. PL01]MDW5316062.1 helix-turn-helix transcriptional regulator [Rhizobium sp. PL01]